MTDRFRRFFATPLSDALDGSLVESWRSTVYCRTCRRINPVELVKEHKEHKDRRGRPVGAITVTALLDCEHTAHFVTSPANLAAIRAQAA